MELDLKPEEAELLKIIIKNYLSDLRMEIADTENYELRVKMHQDEDTIKSIIGRLDRAA